MQNFYSDRLRDSGGGGSHCLVCDENPFCKPACGGCEKEGG